MFVTPELTDWPTCTVPGTGGSGRSAINDRRFTLSSSTLSVKKRGRRR